MKRFKAIAGFTAALVFCLCLTACASGAASSVASTSSASSADASASSSTSASASTSAEKPSKPLEKQSLGPYASGTHHAVISIKDYGKVRITIYSDQAPMTSELFCNMVEDGYFDGKPIHTVLDSIYAEFGDSTGADANNYRVKGEYSDAGSRNSLSLNSGVLAMGRTADGKQSDGSTIIICIGNLTYLNGKYAGFAAIDEGMDIIEKINEQASETKGEGAILTDEKGKITNPDDYPVIEYIHMID